MAEREEYEALSLHSRCLESSDWVRFVSYLPRAQAP
jgi:hypothetical protein